MANLVFAGDSIVAAYVARITAAGGTISFTHVAAVRAFVATGKVEGWWDKIIDCCPFLGSNLAASLVKLKVAPGTPTSYTNHGLIEGNYSPSTGITVSGNTTAYIGTTIVPEDEGLSGDNISYGVGSIIDDNFTGNVLSTAGVPAIKSGQGSFSNATAGFGYNRCYAAAISTGPDNSNGAIDGIGTINADTVPVMDGYVDQEFEIFRSGEFFADTASAGFCFIGSYMTGAETRAITAAIRQMHVSARQVVVGTHDVFIGDSITQGQGAPEAGHGAGWAERVVEARKLLEPHYVGTNVAQSGIGTGPGFAYRYTGTGAYPVTIYFAKIGANDLSLDSGTGTPATIAAYKQALIDMATTLKALNTLTVIVTVSYQGPAEYDPESDGTLRTIAYVDAALEAAEEAGVLGVDAYRPMIATEDPAQFLIDTVHLNNLGAVFVRDLVMDALEEFYG